MLKLIFQKNIWLNGHYKNAEKKIYCYSGIGVQPLINIFNYIQEREKIDYLFVVDGGCDGILRGDEFTGNRCCFCGCRRAM